MIGVYLINQISGPPPPCSCIAHHLPAPMRLQGVAYALADLLLHRLGAAWLRCWQAPGAQVRRDCVGLG
eukprot:8602508-Alexandrium_andersonii.AAC.1